MAAGPLIGGLFTTYASWRGAVLIAALTASLTAGIQNNPSIPADVKSKAKTELASGVPFVSDKDLQVALDKAGVPKQTADAIVDENATARIAALRSSLSVVAVIALIALFCSLGIPTEQPATARAQDAGEDGEAPTPARAAVAAP